MRARRHPFAGRVCHLLFLLGLLALASAHLGCRSSSRPLEDEARAAGKTSEDFAADSFDHFSRMDVTVPPDLGAGQFNTPKFESAHINGRNTWMLWTGGNEAFWDWLANYTPGFIDLLKLVDFNPERPWRRFERAGLIVEPETQVPVTADRYGLYIRQRRSTARGPDESRFGRSSGIVGLRLYANPNFDAAAAKRWDVNRYYNDPSYYLDPSLVRPYRVGMSCGLCHVGPHPLNPPKDVEEPGWENLSATIGNQYLRTRMVFGNLLEPDNYFYHVLDSQLPGALDTSLIPSDNINNANAQNAIFELGGRLDRAGLFLHRTKEYELEYLKRYGTNSKETAATAAISWPVLFDGTKDAYVNPRPVPRVLIDGSDSIGAWTALARVYLNIGTFHQRWVTLHNPVFGFSRSRPFIMEDADLNSTYWQATKALMGDVAKYLLKASTPMKLKDAPGGSSYLKGAGVPWAPELENGRRVFASRCIVCHSSKQPRMFDETPAGSLLTLLSNPDYANWAKDEVKSEEFWRDNYLSSDRRLPVSLVKTNAARSLASNGTAGKLWQEFSSEDYKRLPAVDAISIWNPFTSKAENVNLPGGGRGYYRPPSLVAVWATAPLLHNNSVGRFNNDPSVEGRVLAFRDAIGKLLASGATDEAASTARRALGSDLNGATLNRLEHDRGLIWRLPRTAQLRIPANQLPLFVASACSLPVAFVQQPWIVPAAVFALAGFCLIGGRWLRRLGYLLMFLAFCAGALTSFAAGYLVDVSVPLPAGLPVNVIANLDFERMDDEGTRAAAKRMWRVGKKVRDIWRAPDAAAASTAFNALATELDAIGKNRDHVLDRGHYFGADLTEQERQDLTDLLLTF